MKKIIAVQSMAWLAFAFCSSPTYAETYKETITREFSLSKEAAQSVLAVYNINGNICVQSYPGNKVLIEGHQTLSADSSHRLEEAKKEFKLIFDQTADSIIVFMEKPFYSNQDKKRPQDTSYKEIKYKFSLDFIIKVPQKLNLRLFTVNEGDVEVTSVSGGIKANNINGHIILKNVEGKTELHTINGNVEVQHTVAPAQKSSYYTLNGDIKVYYPANFSGDIAFKNVHNGDLYTNFADVKRLPDEIVKSKKKTGNTTQLKLSTQSLLRIGKGGPLFSFETFNGNIYIKQSLQ